MLSAAATGSPLRVIESSVHLGGTVTAQMIVALHQA